MIPSLLFDRSVVTVRHDEQVNALLEITAPAAPTTERAPLDIVTVIDRSGSMSGDPLRAVIAAVADLLRIATPADRIAVVAFDDEIEVVLPLASHDPHSAVRAVRTITSRGSTNLSGGWLKAAEILATSGRPEAVKRIVLLTDGHANKGITGQAQLSEMVRSDSNPEITSSFIGFANGYDEVLLASLADAGRGNDYFCASADDAGAVFRAEFDGLATVVAQNVSVEITPTDAVAAMRVRNNYVVQHGPDGRITAQIGDVYSEETRRLIVELRLRPLRETGPVDAATMTIRWTSVVGSFAMHSIDVPIVVTGGEADETRVATLDPRVVTQLALLDAADAEREARDLAGRGDVEEAVRRLRSCADQLQSLGLDDDAALLSASADEIAHSGFDPAMSKRLWTNSRSRGGKRQSTYDSRWDTQTAARRRSGSNPSAGSPSDPGTPGASPAGPDTSGPSPSHPDDTGGDTL